MKHLLIFSFTLFSFAIQAQMWNGQDSLYGNEWIKFDQSYFKIPVAENGIFRINYTALTSNNIPISSINSSQFQVFHLGEEIPLYISSSTTLGTNDYIEFYGKKNTSEVDQYLFQNPEEEMLNPYYSMFTDTSAYFLTWSPTESGLRYEEVANDLSNLPAKEEWYWHEERLILKERQIQKTFTEGISYSVFDKGEGFASPKSETHNFQLPTDNIYTQANVSAQYHLRLVTSRGITHEFSLQINNEEYANEALGSYEVKDYQFDKNINELLATEQISISGGSVPNDRYAAVFINLKYPRQFNFASTVNASFTLQGGPNAKYIEIENFSASGENILYNISNQSRTLTATDGGILKVKIPSAEGAQNLVVVNTQSGWKEANLSAINFVDYSETNADYIIISHPHFYDDGEGNNWVQEYVDYRSSVDGGNYTVVLADIQQLYDQFAYGVNRHPLSIRNFGHFAKKNWNQAKYMLLIGKGRQYNEIRGYDSSVDNFFIPTFGKPGADNLLLASNTSRMPVLALGRIPATSPTDVMYYLNKLKGLESSLHTENSENRAWRKEIIHLGGGGSATEQNNLKNHLIQLGGIMKNSTYGGNIFAFYKTSAEPVQQSQSDQILNRINKGVSIITFFGHSSAGGFDFTIDDPTSYENKNRYPVMFSLGCLSGQIHGDFKSIGEKFIFQKDKAAIAFVASTGLGFESALREFSNKTYALMGGSELYEKGIGDVLKSTIQYFENRQGLAMATLMEQTTLNGDPAVNLNPYKQPDYKFDFQSVNFSPRVIDAQIDSFDLQFTIENLGKATTDSFYVDIRRQFPDQSEALILRKKFPSPSYKDTYTFSFPVSGKRAIGVNRFFLRLDTENEIEEGPAPFAENNNRLINSTGQEGIELYIFDNQISAISPKKFAIVGNNDITLKATTANPFAQGADYVYQIDIDKSFSTPLLQTHSFHSNGGLLEWAPTIAWQDSTVYYWRVSKEVTENEEYVWSSSSFIYLANQGAGWNQSHYGQFEENVMRNIELSEENQAFKYLDDVKFVRINTGVHPDIWPSINYNNDPYGYIAWDESTNGGVYVAVMDSLSVDFWPNNPPGLYGSRLDNGWAYGWGVFPFSTQTVGERDTLLRFLQDTVPSGHYIALYTIQHDYIDYQPEEWALDSLTLGTNLFQFLENQGATKIRSTETTGAKPYIFVFKKDDTTYPVTELIADSLEPIDIFINIPGIWDSGTIKSTKIGPASVWEKLIWTSDEVEPMDEQNLQLFGIREDASKALLFSNITTADSSLLAISAQEFPYLQLQYNTSDSTNRTTPQLKHWRVLNQGLPEAVINKNDHFSFPKDTVQQGEQLVLEYGVRNISNYDMDSLLVKYFITDVDNRLIQKEQRYAPLLSNDLLIANLNLNTNELSGAYHLMIEVNPNNDQAEENHQNNIALLDFFVERDKRNPLIDVLFDSERILNGDIVSSKPHIYISLTDENPYFALSDTSLFKVLIKKPGDLDVNAVYFNSQYLDFFPADESMLSDKNKAVIEFDPEFTIDGIYELIIQGEDVTGNQSGKIDYKVSFEIITKTSLSNILNYPNPFSTSTRFVYTLTGDEPPPYFDIQIMTVSGRIVKRLTQDDLGALRPGTHQTDYVWNGTDEYGDQLANGVYIYKVTMKDENGQAIETYKRDAIDSFFEKGYGKLVILR